MPLESLEERTLYGAPEGFMTNMTNVTADGRYVCALLFEGLSERFAVDLLHGYVGFEEYWAARPLSRIVRVDTGSGAAENVFEEDYWIGHANTSPALPNLLTFCHEGPWHRVDNRIWGLDLDSGQNWKIRPEPRGEAVGHEYWLADGERIGYHGTGLDGEHFYGSIRHDNTDRVEAPFPHGSTHFHSNDLSLIVGDGNRDAPRLLLWRYREGRFEGPRVALTHRGSFHTQILHVHPRFSPHGDQILFASDAGGYGNLHLVDTPDFDSLPEERDA
jgi:oligogalacturonide lyase